MLSEKLENYWLQVVSSFNSAQTFEGATVVCYPKLSIPVLNHAACINTQTNGKVLVGQVEQHFKTQHVPFSAFRITHMTTPETFAALLQSEGYKVEGGEQSVMVLNQQKNRLNQQNSKVHIKTVTTDADVDLFNQLMLPIFEMPSNWKDAFNDFTRDCMRGGWRFYLAYVDDNAVGTCTLFCSGGVGGIFNVGTLPKFRGQGIGSALTLQVLMDSVAAGNMIHTLQAETGGNAERLYKKLGFETDHKVQYWAKQI